MLRVDVKQRLCAQKIIHVCEVGGADLPQMMETN